MADTHSGATASECLRAFGEDRSGRKRRLHGNAALEPEGDAAGCGRNRYVADACGDRTGNEPDEAPVLRDRGRHEVIAMRLNVRRITRV